MKSKKTKSKSKKQEKHICAHCGQREERDLIEWLNDSSLNRVVGLCLRCAYDEKKSQIEMLVLDLFDELKRDDVLNWEQKAKLAIILNLQENL